MKPSPNASGEQSEFGKLDSMCRISEVQGQGQVRSTDLEYAYAVQCRKIQTSLAELDRGLVFRS